MKENGEKIAMLTAYDYSFAQIFDASGIDILVEILPAMLWQDMKQRYRLP